MVIDTEKQEYVLTASDRCDADCPSQAYIKVTGVTGDLTFCSHHYEKIMSSPTGYEKMMAFAYEFVDERDRLIENRLKGEN